MHCRVVIVWGQWFMETLTHATQHETLKRTVYTLNKRAIRLLWGLPKRRSTQYNDQTGRVTCFFLNCRYGPVNAYQSSGVRVRSNSIIAATKQEFHFFSVFMFKLCKQFFNKSPSKAETGVGWGSMSGEQGAAGSARPQIPVIGNNWGNTLM